MTPPGVYHRYKGRVLAKPLTVLEGQWIVFGRAGRAYLQENVYGVRMVSGGRGHIGKGKRRSNPGRLPSIRTITWVLCWPTWIRRAKNR